MIGAEKIEGISPLFAQVQRRPVNIEKAPAGSVLSVPFGVGVNSCYCVGCEIIKGAAVPDELLYGAAGGPSLRHRDYRCTGFPFFLFKMRFSFFSAYFVVSILRRRNPPF